MKALSEIHLDEITRDRSYYPSPSAWEDEVLYFLMLDRFSDGNEKGYMDNDGNLVASGTTDIYTDADYENAIQTEEEAKKWREAGVTFVGGTLKGFESKIGYLKRLGVTTVWLSPIFRQVPFKETYHGYGIQNFIDVDPRFGTKEDLISLVQTAHNHGIRVILDIILNHTGDVFGYESSHLRCEWEDSQGNKFRYACWQSDGYEYPVAGWRDADGNIAYPFNQTVPDSTFPDAAVWPVEFQKKEAFTRKGEIKSWDNFPEFIEGDFFDLKDIHLGNGPVEYFNPSVTLMDLCKVYQFWIALADIDGFRVDTVKHMDQGASRLFTSAIHEFTETIGKENFYLIGEITGGRVNAFRTLEEVGMNAALGINDIPGKLEGLVKGNVNPNEYFDLFRNSLLVQKESHVWFRDRVVTSFNDHDQVRQGNDKSRFCYTAPGEPDNSLLILNALAVNAMTMGIPCIYYGTEQCFDGEGGNDRYLREAMFGGEFGAFRSKDRHFFNEHGRIYQELGKILAIRKENITIRRGRQYLRKISAPDDGVNFGLPYKIGARMESVVPWSRIHSNNEVLLAINTHYTEAITVWVTIDAGLHEAGDTLTCLYSTEANQISQQITIVAKNGLSVLLTVPAAGFVIYE